MPKLSRDFSSGLLHPRENLFIAGNLGVLNAEIQIESDGCSSVALDLRGVFVGNIQLQGTVDGTNWQFIPIIAASPSSVLWVTAASAPGVYLASLGPYRKVRALMIAHTSGLAVANVSAAAAVLDPVLLKSVTPIVGTTTAGVGIASTLSLASPGVGLRQYLTYLRIVRFSSLALTAAAAPLIITTTNLPGALAFTFPAETSPQGEVFSYQEDFNYPIAASTQSTAVTIVCPATTGVIWRISAGWFVAP